MMLDLNQTVLRMGWRMACMQLSALLQRRIHYMISQLRRLSSVKLRQQEEAKEKQLIQQEDAECVDETAG